MRRLTLIVARHVTPSRIAKQFGASLSDVRKALASDEKK
jgi:hypothetical protein